MSFGFISLPELARRVGVDARELRRWAERGRLPGQVVGGEWRFNRAAILEWLQQHMHGLDPAHVEAIERSMRQAPTARDALIAAYLSSDAVDLCLPARSRASVLKELVQLVQRTGLVYDAQGLHAALVEREALGSTGLPAGLAFPHPRRPMPYAAAAPLLALAHVPAGIPFGAPDGGLTDVFVLVCAPDENLHLGLLARLSLMFSHTMLADAIRESGSSDDALAAMLATERELLERA